MRHSNRPTYLNWLSDSTLFVADGYNRTRVAKCDKEGKFLLDWGKKGAPLNEMRPYCMTAFVVWLSIRRRGTSS